MTHLIDSPVALIAVAFVVVYATAAVIVGMLLSGSVAALAVVFAGVTGLSVLLCGWMLRMADDGSRP